MCIHCCVLIIRSRLPDTRLGECVERPLQRRRIHEHDRRAKMAGALPPGVGSILPLLQPFVGRNDTDGTDGHAGRL